MFLFFEDFLYFEVKNFTLKWNFLKFLKYISVKKTKKHFNNLYLNLMNFKIFIIWMIKSKKNA